MSPRLGGVFDKPGEFTGKGLFERTDESIASGPPRTITDQIGGNSLFFKSKIKTNLREGITTDTSLNIRQEESTKTLSGFRSQLGLRSEQSLGSVQDNQFGQRTDSPMRERQRTRLLTIPRTATPQRSGTPSVTEGTRGRPGEPFRERVRRFPPVIIPDIDKPEALSSGIRKIARRAEAFDVYVKRNKKWRKVGDDLPIGVALKKGSDITRKTLAARFKVVPDPGKKPKVKDIRFSPNPEVFRNYEIKSGVARKLPAGHFIEKKNKRISSGGEIKQILKAQRDSPKKKGRPRKNPFGI